MTDINQLTGSAISASDQLPFFSVGNGDTRRASVGALGGAAIQVAPYLDQTVLAKLGEVVSLKDLGGVGNGIANDTAAVNSAIALGQSVTAPLGTYGTTLASSQITASLRGPGQVRDINGNKRAPIFTAITAPPASLGNAGGGVETAFNGDLRKSPGAEEYRITGSATLGQPTTGYIYTPEATPHYVYLYNESGWNQSTSGNNGRTAATAYRTQVYQAGQGDAVCFNGEVFVTGTRAGSTNFLANPAGSLFNGGMTAGANGVYLNPYETICVDNGFDAACVGIVNNFTRTNATGAKGVWWGGYRAQSDGAASCDALISATGKWVTGLDLAMGSLDFGVSKAAVSLKANDRIYLNNTAAASGSMDVDTRTTVFNNDYIAYASGTSAINIVAGNVPALQITSTQVTVANALGHAGNALGFYNTAPVTKRTVTGAKGGNAALTSLMAQLVAIGLFTDSTT